MLVIIYLQTVFLNARHYVLANRGKMCLFVFMKKQRDGGGGLDAVTHGETGAASAVAAAASVAHPAAEADSVTQLRRVSPLERIELPTGACLGWVFA